MSKGNVCVCMSVFLCVCMCVCVVGGVRPSTGVNRHIIAKIQTKKPQGILL